MSFEHCIFLRFSRYQEQAITKKKWISSEEKNDVTAIAQKLNRYKTAIRNLLKNSDMYRPQEWPGRPSQLTAAGCCHLQEASRNELCSRGIQK